MKLPLTGLSACGTRMLVTWESAFLIRSIDRTTVPTGTTDLRERGNTLSKREASRFEKTIGLREFLKAKKVEPTIFRW